MKKISLLIMVLLYTSTVVAQEESEKFDFWVGNWTVSWSEGEGKEGSGTNHVVKTLDGAVIQENFKITSGQNEGFKGTSLSVYNKQLNTWKQAWADNQGGYYDFTGNTENGARIFQTSPRKLQNGNMLIQRMRFYNIQKNSLTWDWESSTDGGKTWTLAWRIFYKK